MKLAERTFRRADYRLTSPYGPRIHPVTQQQSFHYGVDYGTNREKWPQYALEDGVVLSAGVDNSSAGQGAIFAWVSYPRLNIKCLYYHLDKVFVKRGQRVNETTIIGNTGTTGRSTGIHLHLGTKWLTTDKYFDPETIDWQPAHQDGKLEVNGVWNRETQIALAKHYGTQPDGFISGQVRQRANENIRVIRYGRGGSQFVRALQKDLGITVDGFLGPQTVSALQRGLGLAVDGYISPVSNTVREMQRRLNEGTFGVWK
jgi:hypothetical protein